MRQFFLSLLIFLSLISVIGCTGDGKSSNLTVKSGDQNIKYSTFDESYLDNKDIFKPFLNQSKDIIYIKLGEKIELNFGNKQPDLLTIKDALLSQSGQIMYGDKFVLSVQFTKKKNKYVFTVNTNTAALFSSVSYKTSYRGFRVIANYGKEKAVIAFVINSDSYPFKQ